MLKFLRSLLHPVDDPPQSFRDLMGERAGVSDDEAWLAMMADNARAFADPDPARERRTDLGVFAAGKRLGHPQRGNDD